MSVLWLYLRSESFNLLVVCCETAQFTLIRHYYNSVAAIRMFPLYSFAPTPHVISTPPLLNCLSLHGLLEPMHLTQMKEKPGIRDISVDSGTVCGMDPLLSSSHFENTAEFKGLKNRKAHTFFKGGGGIIAVKFKSTSQRAFNISLLLFLAVYLIQLVLLWSRQQWPTIKIRLINITICI